MAAFMKNILPSVLLLLQLTHALPSEPRNGMIERSTHGSTHGLAKRGLPRFADFDKNDEAAQARKARLLRGWQDMLLMAGIVHGQPEGNIQILDHYFRADNDAHNVAQVFDQIAGENEGEGGTELLRAVYITDQDFLKDCNNKEEGKSVIAYGVPDAKTGLYFMHFCPIAYEFPLIDETKREDLDDVAGGRMSTFGGHILHELMHWDDIGKTATGVHIVDADGVRGKAYGPLATRQFRDDSRFVPQANADQYRWYAQELFWTTLCKKTFGRAWDNADYRQCKEQESGWCKVQ